MFTAALSKNGTVNNKDFKIKTKDPLQYSNLTFKNKEDLKLHEPRIPFLPVLLSYYENRLQCHSTHVPKCNKQLQQDLLKGEMRLIIY